MDLLCSEQIAPYLNGFAEGQQCKEFHYGTPTYSSLQYTAVHCSMRSIRP